MNSLDRKKSLFSLSLTSLSTHNIIIESNWTTLPSKIHKNLIVISVAWVLLFTAFQSMANLQSSLNSDQGLGTASLSTIYITLVISCLFLPTYMIKKLGIKTTIILCQFTYLLYIACNIRPSWYTLLPAAFVLGCGAGPLWTGKCTYLTELAGFYARSSGEKVEIVVNRFFGIFFCLFQMSQIIGNIISSSVLKSESSVPKDTVISRCGVNDCPSDLIEDSVSKIKRPEESTVYTLCVIYILLGLSSILLIFLGLDQFKSSKEVLHSSNDRVDLFKSTLNQLKNRYQILLIPLTLWLGFSLAFIGADYTRSFVACVKGVDQVGFAMLCFGITNVIFSYVFGQLVKHVGRLPCFLTGAIINYYMIIVMLNWDLNSTSTSLFYIIPACWGMADAAWQTQVNTIYGVLFEKEQEAAFANFRLWESLGFAISYAYSNLICLQAKLHLLLVYLTVGMIGYLLIEYAEYRKGYKATGGNFSHVCNITPRRFLFSLFFVMKLSFFVYFFII